MHSVSDCKAPIRRCNCGGAHRFGSRVYLAHPTHSEPASKEQLQSKRQMSQKEYYAVARAKVAIARAEAAVAVALQKSDELKNHEESCIS